jgi:predicted metalloprotease with PDZ domain
MFHELAILNTPDIDRTHLNRIAGSWYPVERTGVRPPVGESSNDAVTSYY